MAAGAAEWWVVLQTGRRSEKAVTSVCLLLSPLGALFARLLSGCSFLRQSHYVTQTGLELGIFLLLPCQC